jgi:hypothetical protein
VVLGQNECCDSSCKRLRNHRYRENWKLHVERLLDERVPKQIMKPAEAASEKDEQK